MLVDARKHISAEEVIQSKRNLNRRENNAKTDIKRNQKNGPQNNKRSYEEMNHESCLTKNKFGRFAPLNASHNEVLIQVEGINVLRKPSPIRTPLKFRN